MHCARTAQIEVPLGAGFGILWTMFGLMDTTANISSRPAILHNNGWILLGLVMLVFGLFAPAVHYDYIEWDDPEYVYRNPVVMDGLRPDGIVQAFTHTHEGSWLPLVWISFMADVSLLGPGPAGHHAVNILLHAATVLLLFWVLFRTTGSRWRSTLVAALFAIHPLRVESVAWITERKDVLSGLFWMLGLLAHIRYVENPSRARYWTVPLCMLLGMMSKYAVVTFPLSLLVLDFWPLGRFRAPGNWLRLFVEKLPLFVLSAAISAMILVVHKAARGAYLDITWLGRLNLIPRNYMAYLAKLCWPGQLAIIYPENDLARWGLFYGAMLLLTTVSWLCLHQIRRRPYLLAGWLWFLATLLPMIRGIHMALVSMADRYSYIPSIGVFLMVVWGGAELIPPRPRCRILAGSGAVLVLAAAFITSSWNLRFWKNSETLFTRTLAVTEHNHLAAFNLANHYLFAGRQPEAANYYEKTIELGRGNPQADHLIAVSLWRLGRLDEATAVFEQGLRRSDKPGEIHSNLGLIAFQQGRYEQALGHFEEAIRLDPRLADAYFNLGLAFVRLNRPAEAVGPLLRATDLNPHDDAAHFLAGQLLEQQNRRDEALLHYQAAVQLQPNRPDYRSALLSAMRFVVP